MDPVQRFFHELQNFGPMHNGWSWGLVLLIAFVLALICLLALWFE